jgi:hypothetical protein
MKEQMISDLESSITFLVKVLYNELDHDPELATEYRTHLRKLTRIHSILQAMPVAEE